MDWWEVVMEVGISAQAKLELGMSGRRTQEAGRRGEGGSQQPPPQSRRAGNSRLIN